MVCEGMPMRAQLFNVEARSTLRWCGLGLLVTAVATRSEPLDLLQRYPTTLSAGDTAPDRARPWEFTAADVFHVSEFHFEVGKDLRLELGPADLGIGHCA